MYEIRTTTRAPSIFDTADNLPYVVLLTSITVCIIIFLLIIASVYLRYRRKEERRKQQYYKGYGPVKHLHSKQKIQT